MNRRLAGALATGLGLSLGLSLLGSAGAQIQIDANGGSNAYPGGGTTVSSNDGGDVILGDIFSGPGGTTITTNSSPGPTTITSRPAPAPAPSDGGGYEEADSGEEWILAEPTPEDQDADNYLDADEPAAGLDPANPDTDGDSIADGDEVNIFGTDPVLYDTDGDGVMDGDELWWTETDPLDPNDYAMSAAQPAGEPADTGPAADPQVTSTTPRDNADVTVADGGNATSYGEGGATAAPGSVTRGADVTISEVDAGLPSQCSAYSDWYAAQTNYEGAGGVEAAESLVDAVDPDRDGIACEEMMEE